MAYVHCTYNNFEHSSLTENSLRNKLTQDGKLNPSPFEKSRKRVDNVPIRANLRNKSSLCLLLKVRLLFRIKVKTYIDELVVISILQIP